MSDTYCTSNDGRTWDCGPSPSVWDDSGEWSWWEEIRALVHDTWDMVPTGWARGVIIAIILLVVVRVLYRLAKTNDLAPDANEAEEYMATLNAQAENRSQ